MVDIARQTVEFLYEENGGIPRDLYLPTIEDIKDEANKFTIDKVRKGTKETLSCMCKITWDKCMPNECDAIELHDNLLFQHRVDSGHSLS